MSKPEIAEAAETCGLPRVSASVENALTEQIIGAAIEVHRHLGPGLLEAAYDECLCYELSQQGIRFQRQVVLPIRYKGLKLNCNYKLDLLVEDIVVVEIKAIEALLPVHSAQLLTYLKSSGKRVGLLINFNVPMLTKGLKRMVNHYVEAPVANHVSASSANQPREDATPNSLPSSLRLSQRLRVSAVNTEPALTKGPR
jgi:GxxExxY protein